MKTLPIDPVFSNWVHFIEKAPIINCSSNSKSLKGIYFFFEIRNLRFFQESQSFFHVYLRSSLFFNLRLAMFISSNEPEKAICFKQQQNKDKNTISEIF